MSKHETKCQFSQLGDLLKGKVDGGDGGNDDWENA